MKSNFKSRTIFILAVFIFALLFCPEKSYSQTDIDLKQWTLNYTKDLSSPDWKSKMARYGWVGDYSKHQEFRDAYVNYNAEVKYIVTDENEVMAWLKITASWVGYYDQINALKDAEPTGKPITWDEVWHFNVVDGKLGDTWHLMADGLARMQSAGVTCIAE